MLPQMTREMHWKILVEKFTLSKVVCHQHTNSPWRDPKKEIVFMGSWCSQKAKNRMKKINVRQNHQKCFLRTLNTRYTLCYKMIQRRRPLKEPHCIYDELNTKHITPKLVYASRFSDYQMTWPYWNFQDTFRKYYQHQSCSLIKKDNKKCSIAQGNVRSDNFDVCNCKANKSQSSSFNSKYNCYHGNKCAISKNY